MKKLNEKMIASAFFLNPKGMIIEVPRRHIDVVISDYVKFGLSKKTVFDAFERTGEKLGVEGNARDELLWGLLKKGWIRIRIDGNGYINCQISCTKKKIACRNIYNFLQHVRKTAGQRKYNQMGLRVYQESDCWLIDAYDAEEAKKQLCKKIK